MNHNNFELRNLKIKSIASEFTPLKTGKIIDNIFVVKDDFATTVTV